MHIEAEQADRIKALLNRWATWALDRVKTYPSQSAFVSERVDSMNRDTGSLYENAPEDVVAVDRAIRALPPLFVAIICMQYKDKRPQKTKAAVLGMNRVVFSLRVSWIHEQLYHTMYEVELL